MTELDRLARIAADYIAEYDSETGSETAQEIAPRLVRAVLQALREPSEGMWGAAVTDCEVGGLVPTGEECEQVFQRMIDHILEGK